MIVSPRLLVVIGAILAAAGQIFLKLGATGANFVSDYFNARLAAGLVLIAVGTVLWIMALARLPLSRVYPFTALTFVIVYVASFALLGERITATVLFGVFLVLAGLIVITIS